VQLLQLRYGAKVRDLRTTRTLPTLDAAQRAGLIGEADAQALTTAWTLASRVRNALMLVRGRPSDQLPRHGPELAGVVRILDGSSPREPGEFVDEYLRTARRARQVFERLFLA
jgi:glutamate-ammonia-ligase adenylyltransferase